MTETVSPVSAVAPASTYVPPNSTVAGLSPLRVMTGATESLFSSPKTLSKTIAPAPAARTCSSRDNSAAISASLWPITVALVGEGGTSPFFRLLNFELQT